MQNKPYPYPEIITGTEWQVRETLNGQGACTDNLNNQMTVPLDRECEYCGCNHGRMIRRHELGHVKWSPKTMGKLSPQTRKEAIEVLEEIRVNYLMYINGLGINEPTMCLEMFRMKLIQLIEKGSIADILLYGLACMWRKNEFNLESRTYLDKNDAIAGRYSKDKWTRATYEDYHFWSDEFLALKEIMAKFRTDPLVSEVRQAELEFAHNQMYHFYSRLITTRRTNATAISYRKVQKVAEELSLVLDTFMDKPEESIYVQPGQGQGDSDKASEESEESSNGTDAKSGVGDAVKDLEARMRKSMIEEMQYRSTDGIGKWGKLTIHTPPLTDNLQARLKNGRQYRPADFGYNPKYINRYCIDKKIFKQKQHVLGGTILIDASGSMSFSANDLLEIMQLLPAVNIAMYNGSYNTGDLRVIAKNGMRVNETYLRKHTGRGNVVDGPALEWLASQPPRRIWVSDMNVFGVYGKNSSGMNLMRDVMQICTKNKIINLKDIDEVKEHAIKLNMV